MSAVLHELPRRIERTCALHGRVACPASCCVRADMLRATSRLLLIVIVTALCVGVAWVA